MQEYNVKEVQDYNIHAKSNYYLIQNDEHYLMWSDVMSALSAIESEERLELAVDFKVQEHPENEEKALSCISIDHTLVNTNLIKLDIKTEKKFSYMIDILDDGVKMGWWGELNEDFKKHLGIHEFIYTVTELIVEEGNDYLVNKISTPISNCIKARRLIIDVFNDTDEDIYIDSTLTAHGLGVFSVYIILNGKDYIIRTYGDKIQLYRTYKEYQDYLYTNHDLIKPELVKETQDLGVLKEYLILECLKHTK